MTRPLYDEKIVAPCFIKCNATPCRTIKFSATYCARKILWLWERFNWDLSGRDRDRNARHQGPGVTKQFSSIRGDDWIRTNVWRLCRPSPYPFGYVAVCFLQEHTRSLFLLVNCGPIYYPFAFRHVTRSTTDLFVTLPHVPSTSPGKMSRRKESRATGHVSVKRRVSIPKCHRTTFAGKSNPFLISRI
jgi:hypothetical protein